MALSSSAAMADAILRSQKLSSLRFGPLKSNFPEESWSHSLPPRFIPIVPLSLSIPSPRAHLSAMASPRASSDSASQPSTKTVRVVVKGRVQGVFYRDWTVENAKLLGLNGWVRNRRDGSVEALFSGTPDSVSEMEQRCRRGPPSAVVTGLDVFPCNDDPGSGFERKQTA